MNPKPENSSVLKTVVNTAAVSAIGVAVLIATVTLVEKGAQPPVSSTPGGAQGVRDAFREAEESRDKSALLEKTRVVSKPTVPEDTAPVEEKVEEDVKGGTEEDVKGGIKEKGKEGINEKDGVDVKKGEEEDDPPPPYAYFAANRDHYLHHS